MGESEAISNRVGLKNAAETSELLLLFGAGKRPSAASLKELVAQIDGVGVSHDPSTHKSATEQSADWLELMMDGLTFDLSLPDTDSAPSVADFSGPEFLSRLRKTDEFEVLIITPGPHLAGGNYLLPILRGLWSLGASLGEKLDGLLAYGWPPSSSLIEPSLFCNGANDWAKGGALPAAALTSFNESMDRGLQSKGLSVFTGQELRLEPDLAEHPDNARRLGLRLVDQLIRRGRIDAVEEFTGPDGAPLRLEPSKNGKFVRVWRA